MVELSAERSADPNISSKISGFPSAFSDHREKNYWNRTVRLRMNKEMCGVLAVTSKSWLTDEECMRRDHFYMLWLLLALTLCEIGCSRRPSRVALPKIDVQAAANEAISKYDQDEDGSLSATEVRESPALAHVIKRLDADGNQEVEAKEIESLIRAWQETRVGFVTGYRCRVLYEGKPLAGASVELEPESFLGEAIKPIHGTTNETGLAGLSIDEADVPENLKPLKGVQFGLYKVRITHPVRDISKKYNKETELGCEIYPSGEPVTYTFRVGP